MPHVVFSSNMHRDVGDYVAQSWFEKLSDETQAFDQLTQLFKPIMHIVLLVWKVHLQHSTDARFVASSQTPLRLLSRARALVQHSHPFDAV